jgi:hypothetical protein
VLGLALGGLALAAACSPAPTPTPVPPTPTIPPPTPTAMPTATPLPPTPTAAPAPVFSMAKGAEWTYSGTVKYDVKGKTQSKTVTWTMKVVDKIDRRDGIVGYVMQGHPLDLAFYEEGKKPSDYMYLAKANRVYQVTLISNEPVDRVKKTSDPLTDLMTDETLVYDLPLALDKKFGPAQFVANKDGMNVWMVSAAKATTLTGYKGITPANATEYALSFKTNPDRQTVYYVPNIGITRFTYVHNGTVSEVDVKLTEYKAGS